MSDQDTLFDIDQAVEDKDYLPELVGEGKKYSDPSALAKAKVHADAHISRLEKELAEARTTMTAQAKLEDLVKRLQEVKPPTTPVTTNTEERGILESDNTVDIETTVDKLISRREAANQAKSNLDKVKQTLREALGTNYSQHLANEADRLGMSTDEMNALAQRSPAAFLRLVGVDQGKQQTVVPSVPPTRVNTETFRPTTTNEKTYSHYDQMRRQGKVKALDQNLLIEMHNNAIRSGEKFFDK